VVTGVCRLGVARGAVAASRVGVACRVVLAGPVVRLCGCCAVAFTARAAVDSVVLRAVAVVTRCAGAVRGLSTVLRPAAAVAVARCGVRDPFTLLAATRLAAGETRLTAEVCLTVEPSAPA
jgi:hypothetical protein